MTREEEIRQEIDLQLAGCFGNYSEGYDFLKDLYDLIDKFKEK